ncbi:MAG TPA: class I SAM-dependent methyltransferase [Polyangiaceae bacterium]|nr:class I SAM-dependent methyltransferase [Polyangiaceae bacterium]
MRPVDPEGLGYYALWSVFSEQKLSPADAAIFETFVVPRYLSFYGELVLEMLLAGGSVRIAHLGCRTGYPDIKIYERIDSVEIVGFDSSIPALELARNKATVRGADGIDYRVEENGMSDVEPAQFTHVLSLHPVVTAEERVKLFKEAQRLLCPGGQALIAMPLRGSFQEVLDLYREYALKYDDSEFSKAVEFAIATRPTIESLSEELETVGLDDIDVEIRQTTLPFDSGRAFVEDPVNRLLILPELRAWLGVEDMQKPLEYVRDAIDRYWSESKLELSVNVGCASARVPV